MSTSTLGFDRGSGKFHDNTLCLTCLVDAAYIGSAFRQEFVKDAGIAHSIEHTGKRDA